MINQLKHIGSLITAHQFINQSRIHTAAHVHAAVLGHSREENAVELRISFAQAQPMVALRDGSVLQALVMTVNYETTYQGFQDMVEYLSADSRITSVYTASIEYDAKKDVAKGDLTLLLYLMDSEQLEYLPPDVAKPETGKDNVYE